MMKFSEVAKYLYNVPKFSAKNEANHTKSLLRELGNPQEAFSIIHVAGTNGKGSVSCFTASMLQEAGKKVGLFTSPHLVRLNERFRINGTEAADDMIVTAFEKVMETVKICGMAHPTFFEMILAMGLLIFQEAGVEIAVIETGLGGRKDATNVLIPIVSVITSIGLDHTEYLGNTLEQVAAEKAGIIKKGIPVVFLEGEKVTNRVICQKAEEVKAPCFSVSKIDTKKIKKENKSIAFSLENRYYGTEWFCVHTEALYQADNAKVALKVMEVIGGADVTPEILRRGLAKARWPGRMEETASGIYLDGAHNEAGIRAFLQTIKTMECKGRRILLFGALADKDYEEMIETLCIEGNFDQVIVTRVDSTRAADAESLGKLFKKFTKVHVIVEEDWKRAFLLGQEQKGVNDILYCVGSLYFIGALKQLAEEVFRPCQQLVKSEGGTAND